MSYYFSTILKNQTLLEAREKVVDELKKEGFGIISEIDISETLKQKIDVDFKKYIILGACNPKFAHDALKQEDKIGLFLPCNLVIAENPDLSIEVSAIDPIVLMKSVENEALEGFAICVRKSISNVIENLG